MAECVVYGNGSSPTLARYHGNGSGNTLYSPASQAAATTYLNGVQPWGGMQRCNVWTNGTLTAAYGTRCYTDTDVTNMGQVMVQIPQCCTYVDTSYSGQTVYWTGNIGDTFTLNGASGSFSGSTYTFTTSDIDPAFKVDGTAQSYGYVGAYEGHYNGSVLQSVAGVTLTDTQTLTTCRSQANAIGTGWGIMTVQMYALLEKLLITEYASLYTGSVFGPGINSGGVKPTGSTTSYGNTSYGGNGTTVGNSYRGVENVYGNRMKYIEGINIGSPSDYNVWIAPQVVSSGTYACNTFASPYVNQSVSISTGGYIETMHVLPSWPFLPSTVGGSASTYFCGYCSPGTGSSVVLVGSDWGGGYLFRTDTYTYATPTGDAVARLQYMP